MQTYVILRRSGWATAQDLEAAAARSTVEGDQMPDDIRWIRSYVLDETDGTVGTVCIYEASSPEAIREHATRADLPADEIIAVADTVVVRLGPEPVSNRSRTGHEPLELAGSVRNDTRRNRTRRRPRRLVFFVTAADTRNQVELCASRLRTHRMLGY
jgi:hypothetical protein